MKPIVAIAVGVLGASHCIDRIRSDTQITDLPRENDHERVDADHAVGSRPSRHRCRRRCLRRSAAGARFQHGNGWQLLTFQEFQERAAAGR
ncbi:MAG TPA: hypothetical protein VNQ81_05835, partial [Povalibacter sp.]|nr:hypothetical protein [Povalibacter sp.]